MQDIKLFINSPGGSVTAGMGIYDAMQVGLDSFNHYAFNHYASAQHWTTCSVNPLETIKASHSSCGNDVATGLMFLHC